MRVKKKNSKSNLEAKPKFNLKPKLKAEISTRNARGVFQAKKSKANLNMNKKKHAIVQRKKTQAKAQRQSSHRKSKDEPLKVTKLKAELKAKHSRGAKSSRTQKLTAMLNLKALKTNSQGQKKTPPKPQSRKSKPHGTA